MPVTPRLDSQHAGYQATQLRAFKTRERHNDLGEQVWAISRNLTDPEIEATTQYLQALPTNEIAVKTVTYEDRGCDSNDLYDR